MEPQRCHRYLLAAVLILTALLAAPQAQAHGGPHAQSRQHHVVIPANSENLTLAAVVSLPDPQAGQCGATMCCGSACAAPGCVVAGEVLLPLPPGVANTVLPKDTPPSSGRDAEGVRRPPRA